MFCVESFFFFISYLLLLVFTMLLPLTKRGLLFSLGVLQPDCLEKSLEMVYLATDFLPCSIIQADILRGVGVAVLGLLTATLFR